MKALRLLVLAAASLLSGFTQPAHAQNAAELSARLNELFQQGKYREAIPIAEKVVELCKARAKEDPVSYATSLNNLASFYCASGLYNKAEPIHLQSIKIRTEVLGKKHPDYAFSLSGLAEMYQAMGAYEKAEPLCLEALEIRKEVFGDEHLDYAVSLNNLGLLYRDMEAYEKAEPLLLKAIVIFKKVLGSTHPSYATSLNSLGALYHDIGAYEKAETYYLQGKEIWGDVLGKKHPNYATSLNNLGMLYLTMGACEKAEPMYLEAINIRREVLGPKHPDYASSINHLGWLYYTIGDYKKAEPLLLQGADVRREVLGEKHRDYAFSLNNLGLFYDAMGKTAIAKDFFLRAMKIRGEALGKKHPDYASSLNNQGRLHQVAGDYARAEPLYLQAMEIREKVLGKTHPLYAESLQKISWNKLFLGKQQEAMAFATESEARYRTLWGKLRRFTSESQREAALLTVGSLDLCGTLGDGLLAANSLLWRKGTLLDSLVVERRLARAAGADKELAAQFAEAENLKGILRQALMDGNKAKLSEGSIAKHRAELEVLQKAMALKVGGLGEARHSLECSVEQVQAAIPKAAVLVDFLRYGHALGKGKLEGRYTAVLVAPDIDPVFVPLGKAEAIETVMVRHRKLIGSRSSAGDAAARDAALEAACKELHLLVGAPIEAALPPGTTELIICPDGQLHFLAFTSLMDKDGQLWAEKFTLRNISTARDLLKLPRSRVASDDKTVVLVGNPDFRDSTPLALMAETEDARDNDARQRLAFNLTRGGQNDELRGLNFRALQGTAVEVAGLKIRFEKQGWTTKTLTGPEANEPAVVAAVNGPDILHLATHGFFVDELDLGQKKARERQVMNGTMGGDDMCLRGATRDPMLRSGLALSGAQSTRSLWENGKVPPLDKDGILTAAEVSSMRLQGTRLVTLSACQTGLGESKSGEGVLGLQRAIALAGAENLLMTLWSISDAETIAFMTAFYDRVLAGEHPARALPAVQREALVRLRKEKGLWHAINRAAPFIIVSNTAIPAASKN